MGKGGLDCFKAIGSSLRLAIKLVSMALDQFEAVGIHFLVSKLSSWLSNCPLTLKQSDGFEMGWISNQSIM